MPASSSRIGKSVEKVAIDDSPHERYRKHDPWTQERIEPGIPILKTTPRGNVIEKDITRSRVKCPECDIEAEYDEDSEPVCPCCGIICAGNGEKIEEIVIDAKAAGRVDDQEQ